MQARSPLNIDAVLLPWWPPSNCLPDCVCVCVCVYVCVCACAYVCVCACAHDTAPRSGLAWKSFIDTGAGVIDADYRGEVKVMLFNHAETDFEVKRGDRVAQLILERISTPDVVAVRALGHPHASRRRRAQWHSPPTHARRAPKPPASRSRVDALPCASRSSLPLFVGYGASPGG